MTLMLKRQQSKVISVNQPAEHRAPEGTDARAQLGEPKQQAAWQDPRQAAGWASGCSSWRVPSQSSPPAVQHHVLLPTQRHDSVCLTPWHQALQLANRCKGNADLFFIFYFFRIHTKVANILHEHLKHSTSAVVLQCSYICGNACHYHTSINGSRNTLPQEKKKKTGA